MENKYCFKCRVLGYGNYCSKCGRNLEEMPKCHKCGEAIYPAIDKYCENCGAKVNA